MHFSRFNYRDAKRNRNVLTITSFIKSLSVYSVFFQMRIFIEKKEIWSLRMIHKRKIIRDSLRTYQRIDWRPC